MRTSPIVIQDVASGASAQIRADIGFNCFSFRTSMHGRPVEALWAEPTFADGEGRPSRSGIPVLFPFAGRIQNGQFTFEGTQYTITHDGAHGPNAIHGFVINRRWRVTDNTANRVAAEFQGSIDAPETLDQWPSDYKIQMAYTVSGSTLTADITLSNPGKRVLPYTFGLHPYFRVPLGQGDAAQTVTTIPASDYWVLEEMLPTGDVHEVDAPRDFRNGKVFTETFVDEVQTSLAAVDGMVSATVEDRGSQIRLTETWPDHYPFCIIYTAPTRESIAIEPYTGAPDPFHALELGLDPKLSLLQPGETWSSQVTISVEEISAR